MTSIRYNDLKNLPLDKVETTSDEKAILNEFFPSQSSIKFNSFNFQDIMISAAIFAALSLPQLDVFIKGRLEVGDIVVISIKTVAFIVLYLLAKFFNK